MAVKILEKAHTLAETSDELFRVQCRILDLGTNTGLTARQLRAELMELREEIIEFRELSVYG